MATNAGILAVLSIHFATGYLILEDAKLGYSNIGSSPAVARMTTCYV